MAMFIKNPIDMSSTFDTCLNKGDIEALMGLLAPNAVSRTPQGKVLTDQQAIRENLAGMIAAGATLHNTPRHVLVSGDTALLLIDWTLSFAPQVGAPVASGTTTNVVVRDAASGSWQLAILNPMGTA